MMHAYVRLRPAAGRKHEREPHKKGTGLNEEKESEEEQQEQKRAASR